MTDSREQGQGLPQEITRHYEAGLEAERLTVSMGRLEFRVSALTSWP